MGNKTAFLAWYYLKALILMKWMGNASGMFVGRKRAEWDELHESIKGHDTWLVIGNGPSLQLQDIEAFHQLGIPTIASNKINILFNRTTWRPTLYTIADAILLHKLPASHYNDFSRVLLPTKYVFMARTKKLLPWRHIFDGPAQKKYIDNQETLTPLNGFFPGSTITCLNIQIAIWAGAKTIYLIGCDHFYANEASTTVAKKAPHEGESNHFDPNYRKPGEIVHQAPVENMNNGYRMVREIADQRGVRVLNVSRRTALKAFERDTVENALAAIRATTREQEHVRGARVG